MSEAERKALSDFLAAAFKAVAENATVLRPTEVVPRGGYTQLQGTAALFQIRLLRMMGAMPLQLWNDAEFVSAVSAVCIEGLTGSICSVEHNVIHLAPVRFVWPDNLRHG